MILLVEDEPESRYALAQILRHHGYDVMEASDGKEALDLLAKSKFELIITDLKMPNQTGLVLAAHVHVKWPEMPVVLMSGYLSEAAGKLVSAGWAEFLHKPIDGTVLIPTVQRLLQRSKAEATGVGPSPYRRKQQSVVWHSSSDCSQWPAEDYIEQQRIPSFSEMCNECTAKARIGNSH